MQYKKNYLSFLLIGMISIHIEGASAATRFNTNGISQLTKAHNSYRIEVGIPEIIWSKNVAESSFYWAHELEKNNCKLEHSEENQRNGYGENLFAIWGTKGKSTYTIPGVVRNWGGERKWYNSHTGNCHENMTCGHYTQIVWRNTTEFGCAKARCHTLNKSTEIIVCQYNPAGNYIGEKAY